MFSFDKIFFIYTDKEISNLHFSVLNLSLCISFTLLSADCPTKRSKMVKEPRVEHLWRGEQSFQPGKL